MGLERQISDFHAWSSQLDGEEEIDPAGKKEILKILSISPN